MEKFFPANKIVVTGNPVRANIVAQKIGRIEASQFFGLKVDKLTVLVVGGSLGARSINEAIGDGIDQLLQNNLQLIWQTGKPNAELYAEQVTGKTGVYVQPFIQQMEYAYAAADIVVSRAGAMAVTELCIVGKAAILVPFPHAAEDHQTANAMQLVNKGAALIVKDSEAKHTLVEKIIRLATDKNQQEKLKQAIQTLAIVNADRVIAQQIISAIS